MSSSGIFSLGDRCCHRFASNGPRTSSNSRFPQSDPMDKHQADSESSPAFDSTREQPAHPTFVITLVHGTFAPGAPWIRAGSNLRKRLDLELAGPICVS